MGSIPFARREKDERVSDVIRAFFLAKVEFDDLLAGYRRDNTMDFPRLHRFLEKGMFELKEECHFLFRSPDRNTTDDIQPQDLFDVLIGSIFHELMKIKECAYQIQQYGPMYRKMRAAKRGTKLTVREASFLDACNKINNRAARSMRSDIDSAEELFRDACEHLEHMLPDLHTNRPLARMLIENRELVEKAMGADAVERLLAGMFSGQLDEAYLAAAHEYLDGGWYAPAQKAAEKALQINPDRSEANLILEKLEKARAAHRMDAADS